MLQQGFLWKGLNRMALCGSCSAKQKINDVRRMPARERQSRSVVAGAGFSRNRGQGGWFKESIPHRYARVYGKVPGYMKR